MLIFLAINSLPNRRTSGGAELSATAMFPADVLRRSQTTFENGTLTRGKAAAWGRAGNRTFGANLQRQSVPPRQRAAFRRKRCPGRWCRKKHGSRTEARARVESAGGRCAGRWRRARGVIVPWGRKEARLDNQNKFESAAVERGSTFNHSILVPTVGHRFLGMHVTNIGRALNVTADVLLRQELLGKSNQFCRFLP